MKKICSFILSLVMLSSALSMFNVASAENEATDIYVPTEYAIYDFTDAGEASDFSSDKTLTVSDGRLVLSDVSDYDAHYITKSVNIPTGQSFALEMSTDDLYTNGAVKVSLNGAETVMVRNVAKTGDWSFYFDRINGIKVFFNGTEVSTDTSVSPYLSYSPTTPVKDITSIKIAVEGGANLKPKFDYFRVYGYGDAYIHRLSFDDASDLNYFEAKSGTNTVSDGKWNVTGVKEIWPKRVGFTADITQDLIVDMQLTHPETNKVVSIKPQWKGDSKNYGNIVNPSGIHTAVYNRSNDTIKLYQNGTQRATSTLGLTTTPIDFVGFGVVMNSSSTKISFDYYDVYVQGMKAEVSDVTTAGLKLYANTPLDLTNSLLSVGGNPCDVEKTDDGYMTYNLTFAEELDYDTEYTLDATFKTLNGRTYQDSITFETPGYVYEDPTEYFGCDFDNEDDVTFFDRNNLSVTYSVSGGKLNITNTSGTQYPILSKDCNIPADESFALKFDLGNIYLWANTKIRFNGSDLFWINANGNSSTGGDYLLIVDRENGMKLYRNGVEVTDSTTPKLAIKNSDLLAADITSIAIQPQLNVRTTTVGYFKAYSLADEFACAVKDVAHTDSILLKTTRPLDITGTTADVAGNPATITEVEGEFCKYNVAFASALVPGQNYELNVNAKSYTGQTETAVLPFTVTDDTLMKNAETQILNSNGVEIGSVSDVTDNKVYTKLNIYANEATEYVVFTGIFNKDRTKLLSVEKKTGNIGANKNQVVNMSTNLPEIENAQDLDVAVFVWKTIEGNVLLPATSVSLN